MVLRTSKPNNKRRNTQRRGKSSNLMGPDVSKTESSPIFDFSWLIWATVFLIIFVSLLTWSPQDGGWFQISSREQPENLLGRFGASLSDFMIFCFGFSSIWWPILFGYLG